MIRAFVALDLPQPVLQELDQVARELKALGIEGRFPRLEGLHLTLKFLGNVREEQVEEIGTVLDGVFRQRSAFQLQPRGLGAFPRPADPRVVWMGLQSSPDLIQLQQSVESALQPLGFEPEGRPFHPHLTLVRLKSRKNLQELIRFLREEGSLHSTSPFVVEEGYLFQSVLRPAGTEYRKLRSFPLEVREGS